MGEGVVVVDKDNFEREVEGASCPVVVDFWGPQCVECGPLLPVLDQMVVEYGGRVKFAKLNAAENRRLCIRLRVLGLPTILLFTNGKEVARLTGGLTPRNLKARIEGALSAVAHPQSAQ